MKDTPLAWSIGQGIQEMLSEDVEPPPAQASLLELGAGSRRMLALANRHQQSFRA